MEGTIEQVVQNGIVSKTQDIFYYYYYYYRSKTILKIRLSFTKKN